MSKTEDKIRMCMYGRLNAGMSIYCLDSLRYYWEIFK